MRIYQRKKDKRYIIDFTYKGNRIKRVLKPNIRTYKQAEEWTIKTKAEIADDIFEWKRKDDKKKKEIITFGRLAERYYEEYSKKYKKSAKTDFYHKEQLKSFLGEKPIDSIIPELVERYQTMRRQTVSAATCNREIKLLSHVFTMAIKWKLIHYNPCREVKLFRETPRERKVLDDSEIRRLMGAIEESQSKHLKLFTIIGLNTAMRPSEILSLKWENINFKNRFLEIIDSKTEASRRRVGMNEDVIIALKEAKNGYEYVFFNPDTQKPIKCLRIGFERAAKKAKLKDVIPYCLRHTAITRMVNFCKVDLDSVARVVGHSKVEMTRRYCHPGRENLLNVVDQLAQNLRFDLVTKVVNSKNIEEKPQSLTNYN